MRRAWTLVMVAGTLLAGGAPGAAAFTPKVRLEVARRAVTLMPTALARQLRRHMREVQAGVLEGSPGGGAGPSHVLNPGDADARLAAEVERAVGLLNQQAPMSQVAQVFGRIARIAADLSFCLNIGPEDPRAAGIRDSFARYVEEKLPRMSLTFGGYPDERLAEEDVAGFARATAAAARRDYDSVLRSYFPPGRTAAAQDFDDRSVAFAAASLETSLALTSTARAWLFAWWRANGDLAGTPFLTSGPGKDSSTPESPRPAARAPQ